MTRPFVLGLLCVLLFFALGLLVVAAFRPARFSVERSTLIAAPPTRIFPLLENFRRWPEWSPYEQRDPAMRREFGGPARGVGAHYSWSGDSSIGKGRMRITRSEAARVLELDLDFERPMSGHNVVRFSLLPEGTATRVVWRMEGAAPLLSRLIGLFIDMDAMIGHDFESGLAALKRASEERMIVHASWLTPATSG